MDIEDVCQEVKDGKFSLTVRVADKSFECPLIIAYDREKRRYRISSDSDVDPEDLKFVQLDQVFHTKSGLPHEGVLTFLNRTQSFRVLPQTDNVIYVHGEFYQPVIKIGKKFDPESFQVGKTLLTFPGLLRGKKRSFEKGQKCLPSGVGWEPGSLFDLIDKLGDTDKELSLEMGDPEILVCDDMDNEMADFILADSKRRLVAFIHAKVVLSHCNHTGLRPSHEEHSLPFNVQRRRAKRQSQEVAKEWSAPPWLRVQSRNALGGPEEASRLKSGKTSTRLSETHWRDERCGYSSDKRCRRVPLKNIWQSRQMKPYKQRYSYTEQWRASLRSTLRCACSAANDKCAVHLIEVCNEPP